MVAEQARALRHVIQRLDRAVLGFFRSERDNREPCGSQDLEHLDATLAAELAREEAAVSDNEAYRYGTIY